MRSNVGIVVKNAFALLVIRILTPLSVLLIFIYASRTLSVEDVGKYSLLLAFLQIVQNLPLLGLNPYIVREISKDKTSVKKYVSNLSTLGLAVSIAIAVFLVVLAKLLHYPIDVFHGMILVGLATIVSSFTLIGEAVFVGYERMELITYVAVAESLVKLGAGFFLLKAGFGFLSLIALMGVSRLLAGFAYFLILQYVSKEKIKLLAFDAPFIKTLLGTSRIFFASSLCSMLISRADFVVLSKLRNFEEVGYYNAAYRILDLCLLLVSSVSFSIFPFFSRLLSEKDPEWKKKFEKIMKYLFVMMCLVVTLGIAYSPSIIRLFYTNNYTPSVKALQILLITALASSLDQLFSGLFIASNHQAFDLKTLFLGSMVYLVLLFILIPFFGFYGAAAATALGMVLQLGIRVWYAKRLSFHVPLLPIVWKPVLIGAAVLFISGFLPFQFWCVNAVCSVIIFGALVFLSGMIQKEDFVFKRQLT